MRLIAMTTIPAMRNPFTRWPPVVSKRRAVGRSSLRAMNTIIPEMRPNDIPYTNGPNTSLRTSQPRSAPVGVSVCVCLCVEMLETVYL